MDIFTTLELKEWIEQSELDLPDTIKGNEELEKRENILWINVNSLKKIIYKYQESHDLDIRLDTMILQAINKNEMIKK